MYADTLKLLSEIGRFVALAVWCNFVTAVESLLTRCEARSEGLPLPGPITHGLSVSFSLAGRLWSKLPCGGWQAMPNIVPMDRPCTDCGEE